MPTWGRTATSWTIPFLTNLFLPPLPGASKPLSSLGFCLGKADSEGYERGLPVEAAARDCEAGALPSSHSLHMGIWGDKAAAAFPGCRLPGDGMPGREGCCWVPGSPTCLPAGRHRYLHQSAGQASHTKLARAKQMSPLSAAKEETGWRQPLSFPIDKGRGGDPV